MARRILRGGLRAALALASLLFGLWGALALYYRAPAPEEARLAAGLAFAAAMLLAAVFIARAQWRRALAPLVLVPLLLIWWHSLKPSNERDWAVDVSRPAMAQVTGDTLTVRNVRNFDWRAETDFTPRWETRTYDLRRVDEVDLVASYWAGDDIAHILVSFGFSDGQRLVWSIELRRTVSQAYSALASFFKQSELVFIAADERDIIRLRTNVRGETVRMFPLRLRDGVGRRLLLEYAAMADDYASNPRWYNTITANCTTMVFRIARAEPAGAVRLARAPVGPLSAARLRPRRHGRLDPVFPMVGQVADPRRRKGRRDARLGRVLQRHTGSVRGPLIRAGSGGAGRRRDGSRRSSRRASACRPGSGAS